jgi:hypothetical protein
VDLSTGKKITRPINVDGNYQGNGYVSFSQKVTKWGLHLGMRGTFNLNHNTNLVNGQANENNSYSYGAGPSLNMYKDKKFGIWLSTNFSTNVSKTSLNSALVTRYWTQSHNVDVWLALPWKMELGSDCEFNLRQKTSVFERNNNSIKWDGHIDKKLFKNDVARLRFSVHDLLNQNIGFNRNINSNFVSERTYNTIKRNFLVTFIWNFSKNGKPMEW